MLGDLGFAETHSDVIGAGSTPGRLVGARRRRRDTPGRRARLREDADDHPGRTGTRFGRAAAAAERTRRCRATTSCATHRRPADRHLPVRPGAGRDRRRPEWERADGDAIGSGFLLGVRAIEEARLGENRAASAARPEGAGERALETADRFELVNAVAALALAGEVDEALAGIRAVIAAGQRRGDQLAARRTSSGGDWSTTRRAGCCSPKTRSPLWSRRPSGRFRCRCLPGRLPCARPARARQARRAEAVAAAVRRGASPGHRIQPFTGEAAYGSRWARPSRRWPTS